MKVRIKPDLVIDAGNDETLMAALVRNKLPVSNICNGKGTCGKCKIKMLSGIPEPTAMDLKFLSESELQKGIRLACQVKPQEEMEIQVEYKEAYDRKEAALLSLLNEEINPGLQKVSVTVPKPSLEDERGDWDRLVDELFIYTGQRPSPNLTVLEKFPNIMRAQNYIVTATLWAGQVIDIEAGDCTTKLYGLAIDIGTTSVAVALVDLLTSKVLKVVSGENGQTVYGADVISRIAYARESKDQRYQLRDVIRKTINDLIERLVEALRIKIRDIYKVSVVANTTMSHLFLGLDVSYLASAPFVSAYNCSLEFQALELGLNINPQGIVIILPNIGSFVGGDTVGAVMGAREVLDEGNHLLIDLGTNCELFLKTPQVMLACSTAAGPAFEGAGITHGMRAKPGAIEGVKVTEVGVEIKVIDGLKAVGICGSGLIEAIEQMRTGGIINKQGAIADPLKTERISPALKNSIRTGGKSGKEFVLFTDSDTGKNVVLNQQDIGELQLAKGAVCAGIKTIVELAGISLQDLDSVVLAGTFATYLKADSILKIGLVPDIAPQKIKIAGNAAHVGAIRTLINQDELSEANQLASNIKHVELGGNKIFTMNYMKSMYLEPTK